MTMADYSEVSGSHPKFAKPHQPVAAVHPYSSLCDAEVKTASRPVFTSLSSLRFVLRLLQAAGLVISTGGGMVLAYGLTLHPDMLMTFAVSSAAMIVSGWLLFARADIWLSPEICFDTETREVLVVRNRRDGSDEVLLRRSFDSLGGVRLDARSLSVVDRDGGVLVSLPIPSRDVRADLRNGLSGALPILS